MRKGLPTTSRAEKTSSTEISDVSLQRGPIAHKELRICDLELDVDEPKFHQTWLDTEREQDRLFYKVYRKAYNAANKRIIRAGDELWQLVRKVKQEEENVAEVKLLLPDSDGRSLRRFSADIKDPTTSRKRSSTEQSGMRKDAIELYGCHLGAPEAEP